METMQKAAAQRETADLAILQGQEQTRLADEARFADQAYARYAHALHLFCSSG